MAKPAQKTDWLAEIKRNLGDPLEWEPQDVLAEMILEARGGPDMLELFKTVALIFELRVGQVVVMAREIRADWEADGAREREDR